jgi:hypothetical protein
VTQPPILRRIDAALEKAAFQGMKIRSINLSEEDLAALNAAHEKIWNEGLPKEHRIRMHVCGYRDHPVRPSLRSAVWSTHGVSVAVPKRLSHRTGAQS